MENKTVIQNLLVNWFKMFLVFFPGTIIYGYNPNYFSSMHITLRMFFIYYLISLIFISFLCSLFNKTLFGKELKFRYSFPLLSIIIWFILILLFKIIDQNMDLSLDTWYIILYNILTISIASGLILLKEFDNVLSYIKRTTYVILMYIVLLFLSLLVIGVVFIR